MPELPEVEAWVRELDPLVSRSPIERSGPSHIATLKTFEPPPTALAGRTFAGARRRGKNLVLPIVGGDIIVRVHLMSAGRLRYLAPGAKVPKTPMFSLSFTDGGTLVLTEAGKKKRAGVWIVTPGQLEEDLAHLGPDALELDDASLREILRRERRQLHPLLRDQRALAGIGRAHANEILWEGRLSPFRLSTELSDAEVGTLRTAIESDLRRALALRIAGKGDDDVYRVHTRLGRALPTLRDADRARRLRGAHDLLLPFVPDRGAALEGSSPFPPVALTRKRTITGRARCAHAARPGHPPGTGTADTASLLTASLPSPEPRAAACVRRGRRERA